MENNTVEQPINPLLDRIKLPGETFALPSGGIFYPDGVIDPNVINAELYVSPMTTLDEIMMKSPDLLFSGKAVKEVFARCIPQVLDSGKLLNKDVDFLLACLRKVSYGNEMAIEYTHDCKDAIQHSYVVDVSQFVMGAKKIDPTTVEEQYTVKLQNDQVVQFQPVLFGDYIRIMQAISATQDSDTPEKIQNEMVHSISGLIRRVDEITDKGMIEEWLKNIPPMYLGTINDKIEKVSTWGADFKASITCLDCGVKIDADIPLNPLSFFM